MKPETLEALLLSIKHWAENCAAKDISRFSISGDDCELCQRFVHGENASLDFDCTLEDGEKCPVYLKTGNSMCDESPFETVLAAYRNFNGDMTPLLDAAREELDFLKSLIPEGSK